jgi:lauroyl/myristoyl acyltransferase
MPPRRKREVDRFKSPSKWCQYVLALGLVGTLRRMPMGLSFRLGRGVGCLLSKTLAKRRAVVRRNLEVVNACLAQKQAQARGNVEMLEGMNVGSFAISNSPATIDDQVLEVFQRSCANLLSGFRFTRLSPEQMESHLEIEGMQHLAAVLEHGKGAIVLLAHMGAWEALNQLPRYVANHGIDAPMASLFRPLNNAYVDDMIRKQREALGTRLFSRRDGFHKPVDFLRAGGILGILADQKMREGPRAPYFGVEVPSSPIPGLMHRRSGAGMVALSMQTIGLAKWKISIRPVDVPAETDIADRKQMTTLTNKALQDALSVSPLDGFWLNTRF